MSVCEQKEVMFCGKHRFKTTSVYAYHLHIIDDHDTEHGLWQPVGSHDWTTNDPHREGCRINWYGVFRYLRMYNPRVGDTHAEFICWDKTGHKLFPIGEIPSLTEVAD